ncbi:HesB-like protein [Clostridium grantii]|uniref:HesB-like selenoprotein n=1 Tax=Clostridium grantii DSM 8605 TaxID=1121316 RepID=A0A1M5VSQ1_9CLOT|nr:HesB-like protein [Clostridium grantii]SHH78286.1 HesB-like selenoprotein [Clostridium grantii DSM 8605]
MEYIKISDEAYEEFKGFLEYSDIKNFNIRISYLGKKCSGCIFNIAEGKIEKKDIVVTIKDITFIINPNLIKEYEGFIILSDNENNKQGLILKPINEPESLCNVCPGC